MVIGCCAFAYAYAQSNQGAECSQDEGCIVDYVPDDSDVTIAYPDYAPIYYGHLSKVQGELPESYSWVFTFDVNKTINGDESKQITVRLAEIGRGEPLPEGDYLLSLDNPRDGYTQRIARADHLTQKEVEQINTPADAREILMDNHGLAYASR